MSEILKLEVVTPLEVVISKDVDQVVAPGEIGEFGVLPGHISFVSTLSPGLLKYYRGSDFGELIVHGGVADVRDDKVRILTDKTEDPSSIDKEKARREYDELIEQYKESKDKPESVPNLEFKLRLAKVRAGIN